MSIHSEKTEITGVVTRLLASLSSCISSQIGRSDLSFRASIGDLAARYFDYLADGTFSQKLLDCFTAARNSNVKLSGLVVVHTNLFAENPVGEISQAIVEIAIVYCLSAESRIITGIVFVSRDDVDTMIQSTKAVFDAAKIIVADSADSSSYQNLISLAGSLTSYLAKVSRPLPRVIQFNLAVGYPALSLSQYIYHVADRSDEIIDENKIIHPAFCPRSIRGLAT